MNLFLLTALATSAHAFSTSFYINLLAIEVQKENNIQAAYERVVKNKIEKIAKSTPFTPKVTTEFFTRLTTFGRKSKNQNRLNRAKPRYRIFRA